MDAVKFIKESKRLCKAQESCEKCVAKIGGYCLSDIVVEENSAEKTVAVVEQWSKDYPIKTRQSEFLKMFPKAETDENGILIFCPRQFDPKNINSVHCHRHGCVECRNDYWNEEVSE